MTHTIIAVLLLVLYVGLVIIVGRICQLSNDE